MVHTRRTVLGSIGAAAVGYGVVGSVMGTGNQGGQGGGAGGAAPGLALPIEVGPGGDFGGLSDVVTIDRVASVQGQGVGQAQGGDIVRITTVRQGSTQSTNDYGLSIAEVEDEDLTLAELVPPEGTTGGVTYEWQVTEEDVVGVGTDHEQSGVGPDEVWFVLQNGDGPMPSMEEDEVMAALATGRVRAVFGTMYADEGTGEWHTRNVGGELRDEGETTWRELSVPQGGFTELDEPILDAFGDTAVIGVGVGRGDPFYGPSVLDTYYRNLRVNDQAYELPTIPGPGQGGGAMAPDGNETDAGDATDTPEDRDEKDGTATPDDHDEKDGTGTDHATETKTKTETPHATKNVTSTE